MALHVIALILVFASLANGGSIQSDQQAPESSVEKQQASPKVAQADAPTVIGSVNVKCQNDSRYSEEWMDFSFEEYDLMDYLQNLSTKYKNVVLASPGDALMTQESALDAKQQEPTTTTKQPQSINQIIQQQQQVEVLTTRSNPKISSSTTSEETATSIEPAATNLAGDMSLGDHEIAESSWQYGIFDRFTRARSTTTTPPPEPKFTLDPLAKIDMRLFNNDECGLRTYDKRDIDLAGNFADQLLGTADRPFQYPPSPMLVASGSEHQPAVSTSLDSGATSPADQGNQETAVKELHNRRQRPSVLLNNGPNSIADLIRWQQMEAIYGQRQQAANGNSNGDSSSPPGESSKIANWPNKEEKDNYDNYKSRLGAILQKVPMSSSNQATQSNSGSSSSSDEEFNLLARRNWLQQQIGNTLQMFASPNGTNLNNNELLSNLFNQSSSQIAMSGNLSITARENMMKKFGNLRLARQNNDLTNAASPPGGAASSLTIPINKPVVSSLVAAALDRIGIGLDSTRELKARQDELKLEPRVIGGNDARLGDSPWSVSLQALVSRPGTGQVEYRHYCGGTIISEHYILTAAHCLDFMVGRESRLFVVIGDLNWRMSTASQYGRRFGIDKLIIHGGYKNTAFGHDIGLIRTKEPMKMLKVNGRYIINSVCLPEKGVEHTGDAELVGWGLFSNRNEMADSLQIAEVPILPRPLCVDLYRRRTGLIQWLIGIELITEKQVCAGTFGRGICQGDSGSALVYNEKVGSQLAASQAGSGLRPTLKRHTDDQRATIIGIVAFGGIRRCSYQSLPGVYMQTSKYLDWILPRIQA